MVLPALGPIARDENGRVTQIVGVIRDTTDAKAAQSALQESEARFRQLAQSVNVGFVLRGLDPPAFLYVSPGYEKIYGYNPMTADEDPVTAIRRIIHPDDWEQAQSGYWSRAQVGLAAQGEFRILRPDGEVRWVRATTAPVVDPDGVVRRTASTGEDITDRKLAEAAQLSAENLARANALKAEFLSRMSHELRTPLNAVLGFGQLLEMDDLTRNQQDAVQQILQGGRHLVRLVDDIMDITEIHGDRLNLAMESVGIQELLAESTRSMMPSAGAHQVQLCFQPAAIGDVLVRADRRRLAQVVLNLLSNAIKYNRPGGRVDVSYESTEEVKGNALLDIIVSDTGPGIGTRDLPRLFVPFDRINAAARGVEGTGLGLTVSRDLMAATGGSLRATSQEGAGSIFTASIPLACPPTRPTAAAGATGGLPTDDDHLAHVAGAVRSSLP